MATIFANKRYYVKRNNGNAKSTTSKTFEKSESKDQLSALGKRMELRE